MAEVKYVTVTIRLEDDLLRRLRALAERDVRSLNGEIAFLLREAVDQVAPEAKKKPPPR